MNLLSDVLTYIRRIIKSPSNAQITDDLLIDYVNRFWIMDVDARIQLFDLKSKYSFQTQPGVDRYNMPLYNVQTESSTYSQSIGMYPVYQNLFSPGYVNGIQVPVQTQKSQFFNIWPNVVQNFPVVAVGNGTAGPYTFSFPIAPSNSTPVNPPVEYVLRGHVDIAGIIATQTNQDPPFGNVLNPNISITSIDPAVYITSQDIYGNNVVVQDSGQFLNITSNPNANQPNWGLLMQPGAAPFGWSNLPNGYSVSVPITGATNANPAVLTAVNTFQPGQLIQIAGVGGMTQLNGNTYSVISATGTTITINVDSTAFGAYTSGGTASSIQNLVNYLTGQVYQLFFPVPIPAGVDINAQAYFFQTGLPRAILIYNNVITLRSPPDRQYLVEIEAYLSPAAFLNSSDAVPFAYMSEYIARGAARKILADTGDVEQFQFYEPFFREQEMLVWKRSQRQWTSTRTTTIYSDGINQGQSGFNNIGGSTF